MKLLRKEIRLYPQPGPLDERTVSWTGTDLWKLVGQYLGFSILVVMLLMILRIVREPEVTPFGQTLGDGLVLCLLFFSHSRHHFWPGVEYFRTRWQDFRLHWRQGVLWGIGAQLLGTALRLLTALAITLCGGNMAGVQGNNPLVDSSPGSNWLLFAFAAVVLAPLSEELFNRGMLYGWLRSRFGISAGLWLSGLVFAVMHASLFGFIGFLGIGVLLALLYERTGSLAPCMVAHATHNLISIGLALLFF